MSTLLVLAVLWIGADMYSRIPKDPKEALKVFYEKERAEDQLMDPLILAGSGVIPLLERDLMNPNMPRRRYAIGALGNIGSKSALPILRKVLNDQAEPDYVRCDALTAIALIDRDEGLSVSDKFNRDADCLAELSRALKQDYGSWSKSARRTYIEALAGRHG